MLPYTSLLDVYWIAKLERLSMFTAAAHKKQMLCCLRCKQKDEHST